MKPLPAIHAWEGGVKLGEERRGGADTCRIPGRAGGSPDPRERGLLAVLWLLTKSP